MDITEKKQKSSQKKVIKNHSSSSESSVDIFTSAQIEKHDLHTFETKVSYKLNKSHKKDEYFLSIYFFVPKSLRIERDSYPTSKFYSDLNNMIRFRTPRIAVSGLLSERNKLNPFNKINKKIDEIKDGIISNDNIEFIRYELRTLGSIIKSTLRDQTAYYLNQYFSMKRDIGISDAASCFSSEFEQFLDEIELLENKFKDLATKFKSTNMPEVLKETFSFVDEYSSLQIQDLLTSALKRILEIEGCQVLSERIEKIVEYERKRRKRMNSPLIRSPDIENESFVYWEGILKKFIQGPLFLNIVDRDTASKTLQIFYALAAGLAMLLFLALTLVIGNIYEQNTMPFILAVVLIYIMKDRIKDLVNRLSGRFIRLLFPDTIKKIIDPKGSHKIGSVRENMKIIDKEKVPIEIMNIRNAQDQSLIEEEGKPESVIHYLKHVRLYTQKISKYHERHLDLNDIIRFNIRNVIQYADDPVRDENVWNPVTKLIEIIPCSKVYHLNLIFKMRYKNESGGEVVSYKRVRVIIDQRGIKRVQDVEIELLK